MDPTAQVLARLRRFARSMNPELPAVDLALADVRRLLHDAGVAFKLVGGVAVVHHGYARTTEDVDVLVEESAWSRLAEALSSHGFERVSVSRLRHVSTGVRVDLLVAGSPMPRGGNGTYPAPDSIAASARDPDVVALPGLLELKLRSRRRCAATRSKSSRRSESPAVRRAPRAGRVTLPSYVPSLNGPP